MKANVAAGLCSCPHYLLFQLLTSFRCRS